MTYFSPAGIPVTNAILAKRADEIADALPDSLEDLHIHQQRRAQELAGSHEHRIQKLLADAWCAAFVQPKTAVTRGTAITQAVLEQFGGDTGTLKLAAAEDLVINLTRQYRFFHWHIEFPHIFRVGNGATDINPATGWAGGFSCVIGNPPWERVKLQEQEFFASRSPVIANAPNAAARKKLIAALPLSDSPADRTLSHEFQAELRISAGWSHLLRESGRFLLTGRGDINTYAVFAETARTVIAPSGRVGIIVPTGIATDATTSPFFGDLVAARSLLSVYDFENEDKIFPAVHNQFRFCLLAITGSRVDVDVIHLAFRLRQVPQLVDKRFTLSPEDIARLNPNTLTSPVCDTPRHAQIVVGIYKRVPVLWRDEPDENSWGLSFLRMFDMANDAGLFQNCDQLEGTGWTLTGNAFVRGEHRMLPLYEAKMIHHFDSRFSTYDGATQAQLNKGTLPHLTPSQHDDPLSAPMPRYWVHEANTFNEQKSRPDRPVYDHGVTFKLEAKNWEHSWLLGWRDVCRSADERTMICAVLPRTAVGHKLPLCFPTECPELLVATWSSFIFDYVARQKIAGTSMAYFVLKQLPTLPPSAYQSPAPWLGQTASAVWIRQRVLELSFTAWDMQAFAQDLGDEGPPFRWDEERRFAMRAELDAALLPPLRSRP